MVLTPSQVRAACEGRGLIDLAPEPASSIRRRKQALALREELSRVARPYDPRGVKIAYGESGRLVRRCFARYGYGTGFAGATMCHFDCEFRDECYANTRAIVEATDPRAQVFVRRHQALVEEGVDGREATERLSRDPSCPMPFEDAVKANDELGRIDTGKWAPCSDCERVPMIAVMVAGRCPRCAKEAGC